MKLGLVHLILLTSLLVCGSTILKLPKADARDVFARFLMQAMMNDMHIRLQGQFLVSPASVQKILAVFYNLSDYQYLGPLAIDMGMDDEKSTRMLEAMQFLAVEARARVLRIRGFDGAKGNSPNFILPNQVLEFFSNDFDELRSNIEVHNYFYYDGFYEISPEFKYSAQEYFNIQVHQQRSMPRNHWQKDNSDVKGLAIFSSINFRASFGEQFTQMQEFTVAHGYFKYAYELPISNLHSSCKILQVPIYLSQKQELKLLLIMPLKAKRSFLRVDYELISQIHNFNEISAQLNTREVAVRLPTLRLLSKLNIAPILRNLPWNGVKKMFTQEIFYKGIFPKTMNHSIRVKNYVQSINMLLNVPNIRENQLKYEIFGLNASNSFDGVENPFIFIIKSNRVIYFVGRYRGQTLPLKYRSGEL